MGSEGKMSTGKGSGEAAQRAGVPEWGLWSGQGVGAWSFTVRLATSAPAGGRRERHSSGVCGQTRGCSPRTRRRLPGRTERWAGAAVPTSSRAGLHIELGSKSRVSWAPARPTLPAWMHPGATSLESPDTGPQFLSTWQNLHLRLAPPRPREGLPMATTRQSQTADSPPRITMQYMPKEECPE